MQLTWRMISCGSLSMVKSSRKEAAMLWFGTVWNCGKTWCCPRSKSHCAWLGRLMVSGPACLFVSFVWISNLMIINSHVYFPFLNAVMGIFVINWWFVVFCSDCSFQTCHVRLPAKVSSGSVSSSRSSWKLGHQEDSCEFCKAEKDANKFFLDYPRSDDGETYWSSNQRMQIIQLVVDVIFKA